MAGTRTIKAKEDSSVDTFDEFLEGYPQEQQEIPDPRVPYQPGIPSNILDAAMDTKLVNLRYPNEVVFIAQERLNEKGIIEPYFSVQHFATFTDGVLVCSAEVAAKVKQQCPYVRTEPNEGEVMVYEPSGFATRNPATYAEHVTRYNEDFVG